MSGDQLANGFVSVYEATVGPQKQLSVFSSYMKVALISDKNKSYLRQCDFRFYMTGDIITNNTELPVVMLLHPLESYSFSSSLLFFVALGIFIQFWQVGVFASGGSTYSCMHFIQVRPQLIFFFIKTVPVLYAVEIIK